MKYPDSLVFSCLYHVSVSFIQNCHGVTACLCREMSSVTSFSCRAASSPWQSRCQAGLWGIRA